MKINTNTLLIAGVAVAGLYLLTRPKTPVYNPYSTGLPAYNPYALPASQQPNSTASIISASGSALSSISDIIGNFF